jgi:predicted transcriptional regulator
MALSVGNAALSALGSMVSTRKPARSGAQHRTGAPVRRDSAEAGTFEETFFAVPAKGETDRLLHVARRTLDAGRRLRRDARSGARELTATERLIARLTASAVRIYEEILTLARLNKGRVYPSYEHLSGATGLGRATVARALVVLEAIGFIVRQRFNRIANEGAGPRYEQTSNAYRPLLPEKVLSISRAGCVRHLCQKTKFNVASITRKTPSLCSNPCHVAISLKPLSMGLCARFWRSWAQPLIAESVSIKLILNR